MSDVLEREAIAFSRYLLGVMPDDTVVDLYKRGAAALQDCTGGREERIVRLARINATLAGALDGALALRDPQSLLRRKLHLLSAILETRPAYADRYLGRDRPPLYALCVLYFGVRAIAQACLGFVLLALVR